MALGISTVNLVPASNIYGPSAGSPSLGVRSSALSPYDPGDGSAYMDASGVAVGASDASAAAGARRSGFLGQPVTWWLLILALLVGLRFIARHLGEGEEFRNIKVSVYNVLVVALSAIVGISVIKVLVNVKPIPGLTNIVNAV